MAAGYARSVYNDIHYMPCVVCEIVLKRLVAAQRENLGQQQIESGLARASRASDWSYLIIIVILLLLLLLLLL